MRSLCLLLLGLAACGAPNTRTLALDVGDGTVARIDVRVEAGSVDVTGAFAAAGEAIVTWRGDVEPEVTSRLVGETLLVTATCPKGSRACDVDLSLQVPALADVDVTTYQGEITVADLSGALDLVSHAGDVAIASCDGDARVDLSVGDFELYEHVGRLEAAVDAGDTIGLDLSSPTVQIVGIDGEIDLAFVDQPELVEISTDKGDIRLRMPAGDYDIQATSRRGEETITGVTNTTEADAVVLLTSDKGDIVIETP